MFTQALNIVTYVVVGLLCLSFLLLIFKIISHTYGLTPAAKLQEAKENHKFAILIPARNESHCINGLLKSLSEQKYPKDKFDIYVIIENPDDPTAQICTNYQNVECFVRPNLDVKTKGAALDQVLKYILSEKTDAKYEAYFILDADNVVADNFLYEMNKTYDAGFDMGICYRNSSNWNGGWVASCSALTFSMVNTFNNKFRARFMQRVVVSGTGFYISNKIISDLGGYPFYCLTEDMELSSFAVLNDIKGSYNENTQIFDEQPESFKLQWTQRMRWVKGHSQVTKKYSKQILKEGVKSKEHKFVKFEFALNIIPIVIAILSIVAFSVANLVFGIVGLCIGAEQHIWIQAFILFASSLVGVYIFLMIYTALLILTERKKIDLTLKNALITIVLNPVFLLMWVPIAINALIKKNVGWKAIKHNGAQLADAKK